MVNFGECIMILELHRQGLKVAAIARRLGVDRKTVRKYISRGLEPPAYGPRPRRQKGTDPFLPYLCERLMAFPGLTAVRLWRELRERNYAGGYTAVKRAVRDIRPDPVTPFEVRFETPAGEQAQVDLARFEVEFTDEPEVTSIDADHGKIDAPELVPKPTCHCTGLKFDPLCMRRSLPKQFGQGARIGRDLTLVDSSPRLVDNAN